MSQYLMNENWHLHEFPLRFGPEKHDAVDSTEAGWLDCTVPCDVTAVLVRDGIVPEPTVADQFEKNYWIEQRSWWFRKTFRSEELPGWEEADCVELRFASLDLIADVFVNGIPVGSHRSCHYEFRRDIRQYLHQGENVILVRLTVGLETVSDADLAQLDWACCVEGERSVDSRGDMRRAFLRKPQYVFGWDWSPRIATCGIVDDVTIEVHKTAVIRAASVHTVSISETTAVLQGELEIENLSAIHTTDADVTLMFSLDGKTVQTLELPDQLLCSGLNYLPFEVPIENPHLWWPNGMGAQPLYDLNVTALCEGRTVTHPTVRFGIRTVELDCSRLPGGCRQFALQVNGVRIFMKGGDWVPPDPLYARITDKKLRGLVSEAKNANFNTLRIWGGGIYNRDVFYDACDEAGILLWHDFMFACSAYPDHLEWYRALCRKELEYQTRRLRNHPCLALFCGNNEDHECLNWEDPNLWCGIHGTHEKQYGLYVSNVMARQAIRQNCPYIPYWNSSPYGGERPQSQEVGDVHYWGEAMMSPDMESRIDPFVYDRVTARFVSEYGYIGPTCLASIRDYMGDAPLERGSHIWQLHNNTFEKDTVEAGIRKHYTDAKLNLEEYLLYAGLVQGTILGYSLEAFRAKPCCCGGIFWMYDDCWGEVGWTIVDYYLRRKISYYAVRRTFAPVKLMLRRENGRILLIGANETAAEVRIPAQVGTVSFDGKTRSTRFVQLVLPARSRDVLAEIPADAYDPTLACVAVIPESGPAEPAVLRETDVRRLHLNGHAEIARDRRDGDDRILVIRAETYTHAVRVETDLPCSDNYFDLLPDETREITVYGAKDDTLCVKWVF